jgi:hypothetical protein
VTLVHPVLKWIGLRMEKEKYFLFLFSTDFVIHGAGKQGIFP